MDNLLRMSIQNLNAIFSHVAAHNNVFWIRTVDLEKQLYVSEAFNHIWGVNRDNLYQHPNTWKNYLLSEEQLKIKKLQKNNEHYSLQYSILRPDGNELIMRDTSFHLIDSSGQTIAVAGIATPLPNPSVNLDAYVAESTAETNEQIIKVIEEQLKLTKQNLNPAVVVEQKGFNIEFNGTRACLTKREAECLFHIFKGKTSKQIGKILAISHRTVEQYFNRVREKLECTSRIDLLTKLTNRQCIDAWGF